MEHTDLTEQQRRMLTRRTFIRSSGAGVILAGMAHASSAFGAELAPKDKQPPNIIVPGPAAKKAGFAIVGLGELSLTQILPAFAVSALGKPVALVSGHREKAEHVAEHYGVPPSGIYSYENFDALKNNPAVDIVYIVLPNSMHAEFAERALKCGKHVLCEKPFTTSVADAERVIRTAADVKRKLMIAYRLRYEPFNQKMIDIAQSKKFGAIHTIVADNIQDTKAPNIRLSRALGGGPLGDVGVYCINACRYLTGEEPIEVSAQAFRPDDDERFAEVPDRILFQLRFASGILANCSAGFSSHTSRRYQVFCQRGWFGLDPAFAYSGLAAHVGTETGVERLQIEAANHFAAEMDHFASCVLNNKEPCTPGEDGLRDVRIMEKIVEAAEMKRVVSL